MIKYKKLYGNSFNDDIFFKNNYGEKIIKEDIKVLLSIEDSQKLNFLKINMNNILFHLYKILILK